MVRTLQSSQPCDLCMKYRVYSLDQTKTVLRIKQKTKTPYVLPRILGAFWKFGTTPGGGLNAGVSSGRVLMSILQQMLKSKED